MSIRKCKASVNIWFAPKLKTLEINKRVHGCFGLGCRLKWRFNEVICPSQSREWHSRPPQRAYRSRLSALNPEFNRRYLRRLYPEPRTLNPPPDAHACRQSDFQ